MKVACKRCGKNFDNEGRKRVLCKRCGQTKKLPKEKLCTRCKQPIIGRNHTASLCIPCMEKYRKYPTCKMCKQVIRNKRRNSTYCHDCLKIRITQYQSVYRKKVKR